MKGREKKKSPQASALSHSDLSPNHAPAHVPYIVIAFSVPVIMMRRLRFSHFLRVTQHVTVRHSTYSRGQYGHGTARNDVLLLEIDPALHDQHRMPLVHMYIRMRIHPLRDQGELLLLSNNRATKRIKECQLQPHKGNQSAKYALYLAFSSFINKKYWSL